MRTHAEATFALKSWDENPYVEMEGGGKITRAVVVKTLTGDIEGESTLEYLMCYPGDGTCSFVGMERFVGSLNGKVGSFVLQHSGTDGGGATHDTWFVVPGSGTGDLRGLRGEGAATLHGHAERYPQPLDYEFEPVTETA